MDSTRQTSPFASLRPHDVQRILSSCATLPAVLEEGLRDETIRFCEDHNDQAQEAEACWKLHATLLNQMLLPVVQMYKRASGAAIDSFYPKETGELELAFRGEARDAYLWLHCMLREEFEWCTAIGCPTCSTTYVLATETTIRAVMVAILYSQFSNTLSKPTANFRPILGALKCAITSDSFWTPQHYPHFLTRSQSLASAMRDLHIQVLEMEILQSSPPSSDSSNDSVASTAEMRENSPRSLIKIKPSKLAKRQMRLREEEGLVAASMIRRFTEAEQIRDTRLVNGDGKPKKKRSGGSLVGFRKSSTSLR